MAKDDEDDRRRRRRDREDEIDKEDKLRKENLNPTAKKGGALLQPASEQKIDELLQRIEPLVEQVNNLYNQYFTGVELRPPLERRKQLDELVTALHMISKPTPSYQFRCTNALAFFQTYKDRWERMFRDLESGKIKRLVTSRK